MSTIQDNLISMARDIDNASKKTEKLKDKGAKAAVGKVANASSGLDSAQSQWDSQAPYVFENLQALDETRLNHLRDVLTQLQTHEVDQVERCRGPAEQCLNILLNVETADEIKTFALRTTSGKPKPERPMSRIGGSNSLAVPTVSTLNADDGSSQRSGSVSEQKSVVKGLRRFGTVLGRRRDNKAAPPAGEPSPERKSRLGGGSAFSSFSSRLGRSKDLPTALEEPQNSPTPSRTRPRLPFGRSSQASTQLAAGSPTPQYKRQSVDRTSGSALDVPRGSNAQAPITNGMQSDIGQLQGPRQLVPPSAPSTEFPAETQRDAEGFSVPPSGLDAISQAEREAAEANEGSTPQLKVDIQSAPIREEEGDAQTALTNVANTLKMQAPLPIPRKSGTVRGRRDRNVPSTFIAEPQTAPGTVLEEPSTAKDIQLSQAISPPLMAPSSFIPAFSPSAASPLSSFRPVSRSDNVSDERTATDNHSIRSGKSLSSTMSQTVKHPDLSAPGLNSSVVETISAWFDQGQVTRAVMIGELALAYNAADNSAPSGTATIRLEKFYALEKVALNPAFITATPDKSGEYTVGLSNIAKTAVAFKYQVHLQESALTTHAPLLLMPASKIEPTQTSVILSYSLNPAFALHGRDSITLSNVSIALHLDGTKASSCQSKPTGVFSREKNLIYWQLGDIVLAAGAGPQKLLARFITESEAKLGNVEASWDINGGEAQGLGSGISVSSLSHSREGNAESTDPFADEDAPGSGLVAVWKGAMGTNRLTSGTYVAH
ncbi:Suppressor of Profilin deletion [Elasticomyces elasticus]|nr:Suppressor of Profilin deletion [Elasticomyces elasticus]